MSGKRKEFEDLKFEDLKIGLIGFLIALFYG